MVCDIMHKRIAVASVVVDEYTGTIQKVNNVIAPAHLPVGVSFRNGFINRAELSSWWINRSIPTSRDGLQEALMSVDLAHARELLVRCLGLSLSDQYWIKPQNSDLTWDKVNFFDNDFSEDLGDALFEGSVKPEHLDFKSPDATLEGDLRKRWKIIDGQRTLIKGGSEPFYQQPLNEAIASDIMDLLDVPHVKYGVAWNNGFPFSLCENFITRDTELVSAWRIINAKKKSNSTSFYQHFVNCCAEFGGIDFRNALDQMFVVDFLISNEDRHLNNFGAVRNAETLEWLGFAPIYDSGNSLGYNKSAYLMYSDSNYVCKPFKKTHAEQLSLVSSFDWIDFDNLNRVEEIVAHGFDSYEAKTLVGDDRISMIVNLAKRRVRELEVFANSRGVKNKSRDNYDAR